MTYPNTKPLKDLATEIELFAQLKHEQGAGGVQRALDAALRALVKARKDIERLPDDPRGVHDEPNALRAIQACRPKGPRRIWEELNAEVYREKLEGALLGRFAGCTLGAPVELFPIEKMQHLAKRNGDAFPPLDYWSEVDEPETLHYAASPRWAYTRTRMKGVPVDDDIVYTLLGLLIAEEHGPEFTTDDVAASWLKYLPYACTAEDIALRNLKKGVPPRKAAEKDNPYCAWIGADIRSDPWGYMAPGWPERAAAMAYQDAYLSHRRQGIYGAMFFSAAIAAAFTVEDPVDALRIALTEIPQSCALAKALRWALRTAPSIRGYRDARVAVDKRFAGMDPVHTINNACLTVWGISIGGRDLTRVIGETVAMGLDNDCTAATAGSIVGAVVGKRGIPKHWHARFDNTVHSYLIGKKRFTIDGLVRRFEKQARRVHTGAAIGRKK